jgi:NADPH:quinone reductase-like Zn-dependent oxidoreductase
MMKAITCDRYGPPEVLEFQDVAKPAPATNEVLIKVRSASLNAADWHVMRGDPFFMRFAFGFRRPKVRILGADVSGVVEAVGKDVSRFKVGDEVFGDLSGFASEGVGFGAFAEYVCGKESHLVHKPSNISFNEAAAIPLAAITALQALRDKSKLRPGDSVLIHGASGGVGTFAVQIAKLLGGNVTAVCSSSKMDMVKQLGAGKVIDYTQEDFSKLGEKHDVIVAANGARSIFSYRRALKPAGRYVHVGGAMKQLYQVVTIGKLLSSKKGMAFGFHAAVSTPEDLLLIQKWAAEKKIQPVVERVYSLENVPAAMVYLEEGHARGKIVIEVSR